MANSTKEKNISGAHFASTNVEFTNNIQKTEINTKQKIAKANEDSCTKQIV